MMHPPKDQVPHQAGYGYQPVQPMAGRIAPGGSMPSAASLPSAANMPPAGSASPVAANAADWQALYSAMLGHLTSNVETWLQGYLRQMMDAGQTPAQTAQAVPAAASEAQTMAVGGTQVRFVVPPWLEPFKDPANVRFTRTPDHILMQEKGLWSPMAATNDDAATLKEVPEVVARSFEPMPEPAPERRPYVLPPNVRNTRTPDRMLRPEPAQGEAVPDSAEANAAVTETELVCLDVPLEALIADAFEIAQVAEAQLAEAEVAEAEQGESVQSEAEPERIHQPWGEVICRGVVATPSSAEEQDNVVDALASFLVRREPEPLPEIEAVAEAAAPVAELPALTEEAATEQDEAIAPEAELPEPDASEPEALPVEVAAVAAAEPEATVEVEAFRPSAAPANALHMSMLGGLNGVGKVRRPKFSGMYEHPPLDLLTEPVKQTGTALTREALEQHARLLEGVLEDFGIRGEIINVRPGPVVTLYELEPAPGIKSSRVVGLADDIARSMSAISARVAVVQGRNVIGIELPNQHRDMVFLRELMAEPDFAESKHKLAIGLGKTIGGEPVIVDLARMPHLLVAGTTGSGKSVAINTMILSLLYRLKPEECRLIMVDPKMLELSIYDGIPHLLTPVVTDPKKAVIALKWAVREMEDRYKKMSKVGVRNIDGFNARVTEAKAKGEVIIRQVHTGFDRNTGEATYASEEMDLTVLPYIVVIVDEMADLMMVAGKDIEGAIQRLAQMARAAGIHLIMATQRPSVDVITGTIKANFPTRISFQVTSKIDSRTILGEQGAEQLLGQGDMLHMMGGGRIARVHGPFVSDHEVELVVNHLKAQGQPSYLDVTTEEGEDGSAEGAGEEAGEDGAVFDKGNFGGEDGDLYDQAVKIVLRDKKCSTSYIQRRLSVGYNKAASLVEKMEKEGIVGAANHAGKREILIYSRDVRSINIEMPGEDDDA